MITTWSAARYFTSSDSREDPSSSDGLGGESPAKIARSPGTGVVTRALSRDVAPTSSWARPGRFLPALKRTWYGVYLHALRHYDAFGLWG